MKLFKESLESLTTYREICDDLNKGKTPVSLSPCVEPMKAHWMSSFAENWKYRLILTYSDKRVKELSEDYRFYDKNILEYPARDVIFYGADIHGQALTETRMQAVRRLIEKEPVTIITTIDALMDSLLPLSMLEEQVITFEEGMFCEMSAVTKKLVNMGYVRMPQVESPGQFSVRGGILDIFNLGDDCPYRVEFWDEEVDTIRSFDAESQRSIERVTKLSIYPASELVIDGRRKQKGLSALKKETDRLAKRFSESKEPEAVKNVKKIYEDAEEAFSFGFAGTSIESLISYFFTDTVSFLDYFPIDETVILMDEPARLNEKAQSVSQEFTAFMESRLEKGLSVSGQAQALFSERYVFSALEQRRCLMFSLLALHGSPVKSKKNYAVTVDSIQSYHRDFEKLIGDLKRWKKDKYRIILVADSLTRANHLVKMFSEFELSASVAGKDLEAVLPGQLVICSGNLHSGLVYRDIKYVILSESDVFTSSKKKKRRKMKIDDSKKLTTFSDLSIGDYVVHINHGLGIYKGIEKIAVDGIEKDYIRIEYAGGDSLFIPATGLDVIQKYASADARKPKLNKIGGSEWRKTKARVKGAVEELAQDLIELYAVRQKIKGYTFGKDTVWQQEFEDSFPYEATDDQVSAIEAVKHDMESEKIMDRLICGDVGYGKTEVAIRAAFKAVWDHKQVALLVPTTILAQQHYNTFVQRMQDFGVEVRCMTRFQTKAEQKATIKDLKNGLVDIVIGTHRLLSKDIEYKDLGLLIVDEEQRFGVSHKEKLKKLRENVDVLTLSATPIPRTLHMSLVGIRDMSTLNEPPVDRVPIQTYVMEYNEELVREAIVRELARDGQVYYVYNRVIDIAEIALIIQKLVPDAVVEFAHGKMSERELERVMYRFINHEIDVLVSTTIIETGLDIANANTMIIHDADRMGLSQLYQLRGRVGRSGRTAYAFLMYRRDKMLKEVAEKRLAAIREFSDFGSGFKIAMRDLEIRGAGNLLGTKQSGHMEAVGYELYCQMLGEAVRDLKEPDQKTEHFETNVDLNVDAFIPSTYIKSEEQKLAIYKRIAAIDGEAACEEMLDELTDRFGDPPRSALNLLEVALLKNDAKQAYVVSLACKGRETKIEMLPEAPVDPMKIPELITKYRGRMKFKPGPIPYFTLSMRPEEIENILKCEKNVIKDIKSLLVNMKSDIVDNEQI